MKTKPLLSSCEHPMPVGSDDGMTPRLITQWNKAGTIWCNHLSTKEGVVNRICFIPASCECFPIRNRISLYQVSGAVFKSFWEIIPASCEWGLSLRMDRIPNIMDAHPRTKEVEVTPLGILLSNIIISLYNTCLSYNTYQ